MQLQGKKAVILVEEIYNDYELYYPYYRLIEAGAEVYLVGSESKKKYNGKAGTHAVSTHGAAEIDAADFEVIVIPGGYAPDHMRRHQSMIDLVRSFYDKDKVVAAICHAGWMLASAGILSGKKVTSFFAIKDDLLNAGADWRDEEVVVDGKLVTSRKPDDLPAFMRTILTLV